MLSAEVCVSETKKHPCTLVKLAAYHVKSEEFTQNFKDKCRPCAKGKEECKVSCGKWRAPGERCGEHLPTVMVHSLSLWPLGPLKTQDGERKREGRGWGGWRRVGMAQNFPHFHLLHSSYPRVNHHSFSFAFVQEFEFVEAEK